jgi:ketosteroid isomerase-like protein
VSTIARELHDQMFEAIERRDLDQLRALYHAEYSYTGSDGEEQKGPDLGVAVSKMFLDALPDARLDVRTRYACGDVTGHLTVT